MPTLNFSVFLDKVADGTKTQTIRIFDERKYKIFSNAIRKEGALTNYTGMRTKSCRPLLKGATLTGVYPFHFYRYNSGREYEYCIETDREIPFRDRTITGIIQRHEQLYDIAHRDGFGFWDELVRWFLDKYGEELVLTKPFMIIRWV